MDTLLAAYKEMIDEEESGFYEEAESLWSRYDAADEKMMELAGQGRTEEARAILEGECVELYNSLNGAFQEIITYNTEGSDDATEESFSSTGQQSALWRQLSLRSFLWAFSSPL